MAIIETDILIVGAGPTGLTLACQLAARGVNFRIIEAAAAPQKGSRGKGLQPRTLGLFDDMNIGSDVIANGAFNIIARHYDETGSFQDEALHA
jgi:2-polyprenyl-6-methoxyphenol hydroxylase-like FAD-dependent oxidoreductase